MSGVFIGGMLIFSDVHYTPEQIGGHDARGARSVPRRRTRRRQTTLHHGIAAMVLLWALLVALAKFPPVDAAAGDEHGRRLPRPEQFPRYWLGVFAQFAYVGAQVGVWSFLIRYTQYNFPGTIEKEALRWLPISLACSSPGGSSARC